MRIKKTIDLNKNAEIIDLETSIKAIKKLNDSVEQLNRTLYGDLKTTSLIDGSRAFTGVVDGITPTATAHLVTKEYSDSTKVICVAKRTNRQEIVKNSPRIVFWDDADEIDSDSMHSPTVDNTKITIPTGAGGIYFVTAQVEWEASISNYLKMGLNKNTVQVVANNSVITTAMSITLHYSQSLNYILDLSAGDYLQITVEIGGTTTYLSQTHRQWFSVLKIGDSI